MTLASPEVVEALSLCGFDWLFIDMEHGAFDVQAVQDLVRAAGTAALTLVRVPENSALWIKRVLDTGCDGIIVPLVRSSAEARQAVDAARYPPLGHRSVGVGRAHGYGLGFAEYTARANDWISVIVQVEHVRAVETIEEILDVDGIDGILIGPYDLSGSMNLLGQVNHPQVKEAIAAVREACRRRAIPTGIFVLNPEAMEAQLALGVGFIAVGTDVSFMTATGRRVLHIAQQSG